MVLFSNLVDTWGQSTGKPASPQEIFEKSHLYQAEFYGFHPIVPRFAVAEVEYQEDNPKGIAGRVENLQRPQQDGEVVPRQRQVTRSQTLV
jgi:hypothetical protein